MGVGMTAEERVDLLRSIYGSVTHLGAGPDYVCISTQKHEGSFDSCKPRPVTSYTHFFKAPEGYITSREFAALRGISQTRMAARLLMDRVPGATKYHDKWIIPITEVSQ